jgi:hypothetical protein
MVTTHSEEVVRLRPEPQGILQMTLPVCFIAVGEEQKINNDNENKKYATFHKKHDLIEGTSKDF